MAKSNNPPKLVIFDCDGVLVDTEQIANEVLADVITGLGLPMSATECQATFTGRTLESVMAMVADMTGKDLPANWPDMIREKDLIAFDAGIDPIEGVADVVADLKERGIPWCVGSSGKYEKMHRTLGSAGLLPLFKDVLYSAQDCAEGKPAPDIFLYAARGMGHDPAECVVIEDSVPGIMAARAAGMKVFGYTADPHAQTELMAKEGAVLFDRMADLPKLLFG